MARATSLVPFGVAFATIAMGFFGSTIYVEARSAAIDHEIGQMEVNSAPSVAHLASARAALRHIENGVERLTRASPGAREAAKQRIVAAEAELDREVAAELATPNYPGEVEAYALAKQAIGEIESKIAAWLVAPRGDAPFEPLDIYDVVDRADDALTLWSAVNGSHQSKEIALIKEVRSETLHLSLLLDGLCALLSVAAAMVALRALKEQRAAEDVHEKMLVDRARELEIFATRVAHDLLSPLSALSFVLASVRVTAAKGAPVTDLIVRADACLKRAQRLIDGALDFARSGAAKNGGGCADLQETITGAVDEARSDGRGRAEIVVEPFGSIVVACPAGVLASIVSNLVRNAVKYSEDAESPRVTLRASRVGSTVHVEVEDNGPGLSPGLEATVFDPYVRGSDTKPGLGLGLATVRRFVEAHGGEVGVDSTPGRGCLFWFELPTAEALFGPEASRLLETSKS